ncbi:MAG: hypothetical protein KDD47_26245, partial [Acidobacteria bacterium]|nr:hypothetical protein [Acidobacteriota bacterium]
MELVADSPTRCLKTALSALTLGILFFVGAGPARGSTCSERVQGRIAWDDRGSTRWSPANVERLCAGAEDSAEPALCFQQVMHGGVDPGGGGRWTWQEVLSLCAGTLDHRATVRCFEERRRGGLARAQAVESCRWDQGSGSGLTVLIQPKLDGKLAREVLTRKAGGSPVFEADLNDGPQSLRGFVDLHTHPMNHLAFGGKLFHGGPDAGVLMPAKMIGCGQSEPRRARTVAEALGTDNATHGAWGLDNDCGNELRRQVVTQMEEG